MTKEFIDLESEEVSRLLTEVEEAARAANTENPRFIEPAQGTLDRAKSRRHHIVFGRRGVGKTSLLAKAAGDLTVDRRPIAFVNLESFKGHSYPDVLLSVLIKALTKFKEWFETAAVHPATKVSFWKRLFYSTPKRPAIAKAKAAALATTIGNRIGELVKQLNAPESAAVKRTDEDTLEASREASKGATLGYGPVSANAEEVSKGSAISRTQVTQESTSAKIDYLHRQIVELQALFQDIASASNGDSFLMLDDLYYIRTADQALVLDYFHRISRDARLFLKVGTIRHRTEWYRLGDPIVGLKLGDDADEISLDMTLEKYRTTKDFLVGILSSIATHCGIGDLSRLIGPDAIDRLVLASGGVARDFLALFRYSVEEARERRGRERGPRIAATDVNKAAVRYSDSSKREDLRQDTLDDTGTLMGAFDRIKDFCINTAGANCFLVDKDDMGRATDLVAQLVDLRLLHLVQSRVTVSGKPGKLYVAYMLDLGQYVGERKRRGLTMIEFWQSRGTDRLRRAGLILAPDVVTGAELGDVR